MPILKTTVLIAMIMVLLNASNASHLDNLSALGDALEVASSSAPDKTYKKWLILGEADFSYTKALLEKHQNNHLSLGSAITATELRTEAQLLQDYPDTFRSNQTALINKGGYFKLWY